MSKVPASLEKAVSTEIEALHGFFISWFGGRRPESELEFDTDFAARLDKSFILVQPAGVTLQKDELLAAIRSGYGSNAEFRIAIRAVKVRQAFGAHVLVTYEEWQRNAKASEPADNARVATVLFRIERDRLHWLHVHETWLPHDIMEVGPYDF